MALKKIIGQYFRKTNATVNKQNVAPNIRTNEKGVKDTTKKWKEKNCPSLKFDL